MQQVLSKNVMESEERKKVQVNIMEAFTKVEFLVGDKETLSNMTNVDALPPFDDSVLDFLDLVSKKLLVLREAKLYSDVVTFAFWIRKASMMKLKEKHLIDCGNNLRFGRGVAFHIAPSNIAVNYAYSFVTGLITGNANIVRVPTKDFQQIAMINKAINDALEEKQYLKPYVCILKYNRCQEINDVLSAMADTRIVWGGDSTIFELRKSPLPPRSSEISFADRFSLAVIDADAYLNSEIKSKVIDGFYNDTFLFDQNACTSPRLVVWTGKKKDEAKTEFWKALHVKVEKNYSYKDIQGVNKLHSAFLCAMDLDGVKIIKGVDNLIVRVQIQTIYENIMDYKDNSGFFFEYDCDNFLDLKILCDDKHCQTLSYFGSKEMLYPLLRSGIHGIDRVVPIGKSMDFDFVWDGYNLVERLTREIAIL